MTLTLQHIYQYLPYGLKASQTSTQTPEFIPMEDALTKYFHEGFRPVLRPLSDVAREITHNGETFIPLDRLSSHFSNMSGCDVPATLDGMLWSDIELLHSWFIDTNSLIESGLAISTHDLKEDPYK